MKTTDWKWGGSILGIPVRRHGHWFIGKPGAWFWFVQYPGTGITILKIGAFHADYYPHDGQGLRIGLRSRMNVLVRVER